MEEVSGMLFSFVLGAFVGACIGAGCAANDYKDAAIERGHAHYAMTKSNSPNATFTWNTNCNAK